MDVDPIFRYLCSVGLVTYVVDVNVKSLIMATPRYFADVTLDSVWPCSLYSVCNVSFCW